MEGLSMSEFIKAVRVLGLWRTLWLRYGYRPFMRLAHRIGWHYAPRNQWLTNEHGWALHRCQWCGLAGFVASKGDLTKPLDLTLSVKAKP
jgi:hypothetical protein